MSSKVAIYCRLSEEDKNKQNIEDDSGSIQNQKAMLREYSASQGWEIYDIYSDDDYAGSDRNRPAFRRLLADAEARKFDVVLCKTQSRFTRELELVERYIHGLFPIWGIRFVSIVDNADTANKGNKKSRQINGLVNEWFLEDMSESIKAALDSRRREGFHIGSFAAYGYMKDPEKKGHLIIDEEAATTVREIFVLFDQGYGKTAIARMLNARGVPNPTEYKRLHGLRYKHPSSPNATIWKYFAISDILSNEVYIGNMVQGKYGSISYKSKQNRPRPKESWCIVEGTHEPIIDQELWERVQAKLKLRAKPFSGGEIGIFAHKARCASCGYTLRSSVSGHKHYLSCPNRHVSKNSCEGAFISVERLERIIIDQLNRINAEYLDKDALAQSLEVRANLQLEKKHIEHHIAELEKEIQTLRKGIQQLYLDKVKGIVSEAEYVSFSSEFSGREKQAATAIEALKRKSAALCDRMRANEDRKALIEQYINIVHLNRTMVETLIDHISIGKRIPGTRDVPIDIYWNF